MTVEEIERKQDELAPKDDLSPYVGQWVALRNGHVIASDLDAVALRDNPDVHEDDILMPVPTDRDSILIL
jgi:hypothetical protein